MAQATSNPPKPDSEYLERKSVDTSGRLGSLYDAFTDNITDHQTVPASETKPLAETYICRTFSGQHSGTLVSYLKWMDFSEAMKQSILFGMVKPSGVSSLIKHNQPIDDNTRFLYYSYRSKEEELVLTHEKAPGIISRSPSSFHGTHIITKIVWGFEILCVIPIPDHKPDNAVDRLLQNIAKLLKISGGDLVLHDNEKRQIVEINNVTVYGSETCIVHRDTPLSAVLTRLKAWQNEKNLHHPLRYTMCSLRWLCANEHFPEFSNLFDQTKCDIENIYSTISTIYSQKKYLVRLFENFPKSFSDEKLDQQSKELQRYFSNLLNIDEEFRNTCHKILIDVRQKRCHLSEINNIISEQRYSLLKTNELEKFSHCISKWLKKVNLLQQLHEDQIHYIKIINLRYNGNTPVTPEHIEEALRGSLLKEDGCVFVFYSNDRLIDEKATEWQGVYQQFLSKREQTAQRNCLVYADFSDYQYELEHASIVNLTMKLTEASRNHLPAERQSTYSPVTETPPKRPLSSPITEINVLLLGESGVGKSTFINAFVNYLIFDTLQQAEQSEPVVLIPVSFLTTTGDQFDEFTVKFGNVDANENHEHPGQSVTQKCKSYVFRLNEKLALRLIDTPGMGDTRGVAQDQKNMDHILTYIHNLSHLNAVCLLLKPNASRLNVFFRSCITQLFTYLTPLGYENIIFCFTNARATFFAPGDTGPLLRQMLKKEYQDGIPFQKTNTFCFDSESFRYLAARKCDVNFDGFQKQECTNSWTTSVTESVRLLKYIITKVPYHLHEERTPGKALLEITMLGRPLMETLRLLLYNWIVCETGAVSNCLALNTKPVNIELCSHCTSSQTMQIHDSFPLLQYQWTGTKANAAQRHQCHSDDTNFLIEYTMKYDLVTASESTTKEKWHYIFVEFLIKCDKLIHFLKQQQLLLQDDPIMPVLERFIIEEEQISHTAPVNATMNGRVRELLRCTKEMRMKNNAQLKESNERLSLDEVYRIIDDLKSYASMKKQLDSIVESRRAKMKAYEYRIKTNFVKNKRFAELTNSSQ